MVKSTTSFYLTSGPHILHYGRGWTIKVVMFTNKFTCNECQEWVAVHKAWVWVSVAKKGCVGNGDGSARVGLGLDPACEWTLNPGPALRCIVGRHRNVLLQLLLTVLLTITVCVLASSGHSPPGLYKLMKLNVRRSVFSVPSLNLVSIASHHHQIIREAAAG